MSRKRGFFLKNLRKTWIFINKIWMKAKKQSTKKYSFFITTSKAFFVFLFFKEWLSSLSGKDFTETVCFHEFFKNMYEKHGKALLAVNLKCNLERRKSFGIAFWWKCVIYRAEKVYQEAFSWQGCGYLWRKLEACEFILIHKCINIEWMFGLFC